MLAATHTHTHTHTDAHLHASQTVSQSTTHLSARTFKSWKRFTQCLLPTIDSNDCFVQNITALIPAPRSPASAPPSNPTHSPFPGTPPLYCSFPPMQYGYTIKHRPTDRHTHLHLCQLALQLADSGVWALTVSGEGPMGVLLGVPPLQGSGVLDAPHLCLKCCQSICRGALLTCLQDLTTYIHASGC